MLLEKSRKGPLTARFINRYIHSRYDPEKEAVQLLNNFTAQEDYNSQKTVLVFEPGLGYILEKLKSVHDSSNIIIFFYDSDCYNYCKSQGLLDNIKYYHPGSDLSLDGFLGSILYDIDIRNILFFELPSTAALFSDIHNNYQKKILEHLSISHGSEMTRNHFALKWILNSFRNYLYQDFSGRILSIEAPVILTASGPSLEQHISRISELKNSYVIAALPSSLALLSSYGVIPDILFTTDPGFYAREHLRFLHKDTIIISSVISSLIESENFCCGINQHSFPENLLLRENELQGFPEMGTVAATALFYLMKLTRNKIYITGLDFCMSDIKMHAQPHSFTSYILKDESRLNPGYSAFYNRAASMTQSIDGQYRLTRNMNTYTAWFKQQNFNNKVFRLKPAAVSLPIPELDSLPIKPALTFKIKTEMNTEYPDFSERRRRVKNIEQNLNNMILDFENNDKMSSHLSEFTAEVFPKFRLNSEKNNLNENSAKSDFLYKIKYLIKKIGCISNG
ncbi:MULTISPECIES: 6-hydroxymethylpterin diphosphokinase MptE-like protein [unclassified Oceanispirochaeta]|uniref:6-hydroxymethylpterin diphosphokinase MptE-like protein n=1 Tax=unclassified Oceanispirochaeta TaxID=2635722 RepID=UPI000E09AE94|nr:MULTISPECIES: 6-hydroxymethylpterin diphosphokinase MptE-like protein [unclassified Oceanispirochaeta]MBF9015595.1 motility associated factor glycosyltransferase family protein [Oceanispirochaeta sp. M2]NPD73916.1 motility associated factor glycosyltransferase family protein [Oceanispirochaeta sp. M1]RDG30229.1 DUF115 domain-containing protein [Oceanispirochaeta sp. M1]